MRKEEGEKETCLADIAEKRLSAGIVSGDEDAEEGFCLVEPCFDGVDVAFWRTAFA